MGEIEYSLKVLMDKDGICMLQYIHEVDQLCSYPNDMDNPYNMIDNLGNKCQLYLVSNEKLVLNDLYLATEMKTIEYGVCCASSERLVEVANSFPSIQKKIVMSTDKNICDHPKIGQIDKVLANTLCEIYNNRSSLTLKEFIDKVL